MIVSYPIHYSIYGASGLFCDGTDWYGVPHLFFQVKKKIICNVLFMWPCWQETSSNVVKITPDLVNLAKDMDDTIVGHVVKGFQRMTDIEDEQLLPTELQSADIRINKYNINTRKVSQI